MPLVKIKGFNIDIKPLFDQPIRNKQEAYEKLVKMSRNNGHKTGKLLAYLYLHKYYKLIGIHLSSQRNTSMSQKINIVGILGEDVHAIMIFIAEKQQKTIQSFYLDSLIATE